MHDRQTLEFYAKEAGAYGARSDGIGVSKALAAFLEFIPKGGAVLDLGCGTGRDTQAIIEAGFDATAVDGSAAMASEAEKRIGRSVRVLLFEDLDYQNLFDGIWANASLLHVPRTGLPHVLACVHRSLKRNGLLYASVKSGGNEGRDTLGRYYNYLNRDELEPLLKAAGDWTALTFSEGRGKGYDGTETGWVEVLARKQA